MMNVEGLSRENVASHLQKYRLHRKKRDAEARAAAGGDGAGSDGGGRSKRGKARA